MTTQVGRDRKAQARQLARRTLAAWDHRPLAVVGRGASLLGLPLVLVGAVVRWGALHVGLSLLLLALSLAIVDELLSARKRARASEVEE